jgi:hypothetical protein
VLSNAGSIKQWRQMPNSHIIYVAHDDSGNNYTINSLTGVILVNGLPPHQLPLSITGHKLYKQNFSENNFEVVLKSGFYETIQPVFGCYYRFYKTDDQLVVQESMDEKHIMAGTDPWDDNLELLDLTTVVSFSKFPVKLKSFFSLWVSRKQNVLVLRPFDFKTRQVFYLKGSNSEMKCVPEHMNNKDNWIYVSKESKDIPSLLLHNTKFIDILERFENRNFMLTTTKQLDQYEITLHRFGLEFQFCRQCDDFKCSEVTGFYLMSSQHLSGHLQGLNQYLLLESKDKAKTKMLVPFGNIVVKSINYVTIELLHTTSGNQFKITENKAEEHMQFFIYDIHPVFDTITASNVGARLFLAGLYVATNSLIPDKNGMTGEAIALRLLRQCMVNRPLSGQENLCLQNIKTLSKGKMAPVYLLCHDIHENSRKYSFLHGHISENSQCMNMDDKYQFADECSAFINSLRYPLNPRLHLSKVEMSRILGIKNLCVSKQDPFINKQLFDIETLPEGAQVLEYIHRELFSLWELDTDEVSSMPSFPLENKMTTELEEQVIGELLESW